MSRTPLTYYGGKQLLARHIIARMPAHRVYLEAFAGGAAVLFAKPLMRFWRALRDRTEELAAAVAATPYGRAEWIASSEPADDDVEAARRLLINVDQSFSRSRRSWSVPCIGDGRGRWQPGTWENLPLKLLAAATRLRGVGLEHGSALDLIPRWDRHDALIYLDPPYEGAHRLSPKEGYAVEAAGLWAQMVPVLQDVKHATVLLSGYPCEEADALGWESVPLPRKRTVQARTGESLPAAPETLWSNRRLSRLTGSLFAESAG